ncbi:MAG: hypothetical protein ABI416_13465 [Ginsengibacter sp.]
MAKVLPESVLTSGKKGDHYRQSRCSCNISGRMAGKYLCKIIHYYKIIYDRNQGIGLTVNKEILLNHHLGYSLKTAAPGKTTFEIILN